MSALEAWLDRYGRAWEAKDTAAFVGLFAPEASYHWTPYREPQRGRAELAAAFEAAIARQRSITVPTQLDAEHAKKLQSLRDKSIAEFDAAYAGQVVERQARVVALFRANVANTDAELAAYASRTLPVLQEHQRLADSLKHSLDR